MTELQHTSYYPFGGIIADTLLTRGRGVQNRTYNGKEQDFANSLFWLDYGARHYDPTRGQFTTYDPHCERYYNTNPLTYCNNNAVNAVDPDGRKIVFASGTSSIFVKYYNLAVNYLKKNGCGQLIEKLENVEQIYTIRDGTNDKNYFDYNSHEISWMPLMGLNTTLTVLSPATLLNHEFDHAVQYHTNSTKFKSDIKLLDDSDPHSDYSTEEEYRVINGSERKTAETLGEIEKGDITRIGHSGIHVETESPISNNPVEKIIEFEIIGKMK